MFDKEKEIILNKEDKSWKGSVDNAILPLLALLNEHPNYCTTSSCAGRIVLINMHPTMQKNESHFIFTSHDEVTSASVRDALHAFSGTNLWLRSEPFILHVRCRTQTAAIALLNLAQQQGLKRSGITSLKRNIVEIASTEKMDVPLILEKPIKIDLDPIITAANQRLQRTRKKLNTLTDACRVLP